MSQIGSKIPRFRIRGSAEAEIFIPPIFATTEDMSQITKAEVVSVYRYVLRSIGIAFRGDTTTLNAARKEARRRFEEGRQWTANETKSIEGIEEARNVSKFLRQNLVQGIKEGENDCYSTACLD
jgi:hypothetical protein